MATSSVKQVSPTSSAALKGSSSRSKSRPTTATPRKSRSKSSANIAVPEEWLASFVPKEKPLPWFTQLLPTQERGVTAGLSQDGYALFFEQRTGKTWVAGAIIHRRQPHNLLVCGIKTNMKTTWETFFTAKLPYYKIFWDLSSMQAHQRAFKKAWGHFDFCALITNYEQLPKVIQRARKWFDEGMVVFDEGQRLKSRSTKSSRMARFLRNVKYRLLLSGTPMNDSPIDMWALMRFIEIDVFGENWGEFKRDWTRPGGFKGKQPIFRDHLGKRFAKMCQPYCMSLSQEEAGMERAKMNWQKIKLDPQQALYYNKLEKKMVVKIRGTKIKTPLAITNINKLQQMTGGWVYDEDKTIHKVGRAKESHLRKWLLAQDGPVVIFCKFKPDLDICARVARQNFDRVAVLDGSVKDTPNHPRRSQLLYAFQAGQIDVLICQQKTGGVGVDLYLARRAYVYSCGHSFIDFEQMAARLTWLGQKEPADFTIPYAPGTIDQDIRIAIKENRSVTSVTLDRLRWRA